MTTKLLHIEEESLDIQLTEKMGLLVRDIEKDCEIEISPEITGKILSFAGIIMRGFMDAQKRGLIDERLSPDYK